MVSLSFESKLSCSRDAAWNWMTSVNGISSELWPYLRMTTPNGIQNLNDIEIKRGERMFRSYILLFGLLPLDYSDVTLLELREKDGFVEQSPMGLIKSWRHERLIETRSEDPFSIFLVDRLVFKPKMGSKIVEWFVKKIFEHRHRVLKAKLG